MLLLAEACFSASLRYAEEAWHPTGCRGLRSEAKQPRFGLHVGRKKMNLRYTSPAEHRSGTVFLLLKQAWASLWNTELEEKIRQFDLEVTEHPDTVGACTFITCLGPKPVGMASYDPRQKPEKGIIGWNCVVPQHQRRGFGKKQIQEIIRIFQDIGIHKACVTTTNEDFFIPAQKTYKSCGFLESRRTEDNNIEYEMKLD